MYAASAAPRDSSISLRIESSSRPSCSISSSVRCMYSWTSAIAMFRFLSHWLRCELVDGGRGASLRASEPPLDVERAFAHRRGDAGLHGLVGLVELVAVAQVAHGAG